MKKGRKTKKNADDAFFNRNWAGACRGRWAGPGLLAGWDAGLLNCLG